MRGPPDAHLVHMGLSRCSPMPGDQGLICASWAGSRNRLAAGKWVDPRTETILPHRGEKGKEKLRTLQLRAGGELGGDNGDTGPESLKGSLTCLW